MKLKMNVIDAFTDTIFKGNSAAVIILDSWLNDKLMQNIASENNLSETAFVVNEEGIYNIRWFSPLTEIDFCGHATLASSYVLFQDLENLDSLKFYAKAVGEFEVKKKEDGYIQMNFPNREPKKLDSIPVELLEGLSIEPKEVHQSEQAYFVIYSNEEEVLEVNYDSFYLKKLKPLDVVVTSNSTKYDFISRYFWPANGGDEDPVTGSIHAGLAPFWSKRLNKDKLLAYQASKRGGTLICEIKEDRVFISGKAVQYSESFITIN